MVENNKNTGDSSGRSTRSFEDLPDILYFASPTRIEKLHGRIFLTPHLGIAALFVISTSDMKSIRGYGCNIGYKEWQCSDDDLQAPLNYVHVTHNIKEVAGVEYGAATGYIYSVDATRIKDGLSTFVTNDPNREVIYDEAENLEVIREMKHSLQWELTFDQANADMHGYATNFTTHCRSE